MGLHGLHKPHGKSHTQNNQSHRTHQQQHGLLATLLPTSLLSGNSLHSVSFCLHQFHTILNRIAMVADGCLPVNHFAAGCTSFLPKDALVYFVNKEDNNQRKQCAYNQSNPLSVCLLIKKARRGGLFLLMFNVLPDFALQCIKHDGKQHQKYHDPPAYILPLNLVRFTNKGQK